MHVKLVLLMLWCTTCCYGGTTRIWFHKQNCHSSGFTCIPNVHNKKTLIYECPSKSREYHIYINEFNGPKTLENLIIRNCKTLTILLRCTKYASEKKNLKSLEISNIDKLKILSVPKYQSLLPPSVIFENITNLETIPSYAFSQVNRKLNQVRCVLPTYNFNSLEFRNVLIGTVHANAFYLPNNFSNLAFFNVKIRNLNSYSFVVNKTDIFSLEDSTVESIPSSGIVVAGQHAVLSKNKFKNISSNGIRVFSNTFTFTNNSVNSLHSFGLTVTSKTVLVSANRFDHLQTAAFSKIGGPVGPFSKYEFTYNYMKFIDKGSLVPDLDKYENISFQINFEKNIFSCECAESGQLFSREAQQESSSKTIKEFYANVFDEQSENICAVSCNLSLNDLRKMISQDNCISNFDLLCKQKNKEALKLNTTSAPTLTNATNSTSTIFVTPSFRIINSTTKHHNDNKYGVSNVADKVQYKKLTTLSGDSTTLTFENTKNIYVSTSKIGTPKIALITKNNDLHISTSTGRKLEIKRTTSVTERNFSVPEHNLTAATLAATRFPSPKHVSKSFTLDYKNDNLVTNTKGDIQFTKSSTDFGSEEVIESCSKSYFLYPFLLFFSFAWFLIM